MHPSGDKIQLEPCEHTVPADHWQKENPVEYVPEDIAAREEADQAAVIGRATVSCDEDCGAYLEPITLDEYQLALEHWKSHSSLGGCAHGRT